MEYNVIERLETTIANLQCQGDRVLWDDYEKLEEVLGWLKHAQPVIQELIHKEEV